MSFGASVEEGGTKSLCDYGLQLIVWHVILTFNAQVGGAVHRRAHRVRCRDAHVFRVIRFDIEFFIRKI